MSIFEYDEEKELGRIRKAEREEGEKIGEKKGLMQGAINTIMILKELGISKQRAVSKIVEQFGIIQDEAEKLVDEHW